MAALGRTPLPVSVDVPTVAAPAADLPPDVPRSADGLAPPALPEGPVDRPKTLRRRLRMPIAAFLILQFAIEQGERLPSVDGTAYFEAGRNLLSGHGFTRHGSPELHFPPLTPLGLGGLDKLLHSELAALRIWNFSCAALVVLILVLLARRLWHDDDTTVATAWMAGTVAGLSPLFSRQGGGSESIAAALLLGSVLFAMQALGPEQGRRGRLLRFFAAGLLVGLSYLARPESLLPGAIVGLAVVIEGLRRSGSIVARLRRTFVWGLCFGGAVIMCCFPYIAYLHAHTGTWSATDKSKDASIQAWRAVAENNRLERDRVLYAIDANGTSLGVPTRSLITLAKEDPKGWLGIVGVNLKNLGNDFFLPNLGFGPTWRLIPGFLLIFSGMAMWRSRRRKSMQLLLLLALVPIFTCTVFFVLPRYLVVPTAVFTLFAARGLTEFLRGRSRRVRWAVLGLTIVFMFTSTMAETKPFLPWNTTNDPVEQADAGRWIAAHTPSDARIMTRSFHVQAYAHRHVVALPSADYSAMLKFARRMGVNYIVADESSIAHRRPELYPALMTDWAPPGLVLVKDLNERGQDVRIYKLDPQPPESDRPPIPLGYVSDN